MSLAAFFDMKNFHRDYKRRSLSTNWHFRSPLLNCLRRKEFRDLQDYEIHQIREEPVINVVHELKVTRFTVNSQIAFIKILS